ncbi:hypothetical protein FB45DRAFT_1024031 [Roridomyces roridus]|uniref:Uncharacterized protein n=1 Tax=Roridomyces roridus TaxID=1738132 RepID=A0AAD7FRQ9_9AGAR|nr:hypothetical protein FB45DRAFT_1024031 [Roridomyces roridus]
MSPPAPLRLAPGSTMGGKMACFSASLFDATPVLLPRLNEEKSDDEIRTLAHLHRLHHPVSCSHCPSSRMHPSLLPPSTATSSHPRDYAVLWPSPPLYDANTPTKLLLLPSPSHLTRALRVLVASWTQTLPSCPTRLCSVSAINNEQARAEDIDKQLKRYFLLLLLCWRRYTFSAPRLLAPSSVYMYIRFPPRTTTTAQFLCSVLHPVGLALGARRSVLILGRCFRRADTHIRVLDAAVSTLVSVTPKRGRAQSSSISVSPPPVPVKRPRLARRVVEDDNNLMDFGDEPKDVVPAPPVDPRPVTPDRVSDDWDNDRGNSMYEEAEDADAREARRQAEQDRRQRVFEEELEAWKARQGGEESVGDEDEEEWTGIQMDAEAEEPEGSGMELEDGDVEGMVDMNVDPEEYEVKGPEGAKEPLFLPGDDDEKSEEEMIPPVETEPEIASSPDTAKNGDDELAED